MTKAKNNSRPIQLADEDLPTGETQAEKADPEDQELDAVFSQFPQHDVCIELTRTTEKGGKPGFLEEMTPADFSMGYVCATYGGGIYQAKGKYKDGSVIKRHFIIEGDPFPVKRKVPVISQVVQPAPAQVGPTAPIEVTRRDDGSVDIAQVLSTFASMMQKMVMELRTSEVEMLTKMKMYKELFSGPEKAQTPVGEMIEMVKKGIELGSSAGEGGGGIPWMMVIDKLSGPVTELIGTISQASKRQPTQINPGAFPKPGAVPTGPQPTQPAQPAQAAQPEGEQDMILYFLKSHLAGLVNAASEDLDPEHSVKFILAQVPKEGYDPLLKWLLAPDCLDKIASIEPGIRFQKFWWIELRDALIDTLQSELGHAPRPVQPNPAPDAPADSSADL